MRRRTNVRAWIRVGAAAALSAALAWSPATPAQAASAIRARLVVGSLNVPTAFTFGPGNRIWYVEKATGQIRIHDLGTGSDALFATVLGVNAEGERGMLGIALDPGYPNDPSIYVYATRSVSGALRNQILRLTDSGGTGTNQTVIFSAPASSSPYHNGGRILFGPDGMLYAIVGEGHDAGNAQDISRNDRGKILRMTPSGGVPSDNPFGNSRIFAYGIRNSFGFAFDPQKRRLWETENGPSCNDELNLIRKGGNYGWGPNETCSGSSPGNTNQDGPNPVMPKRWYTPTIAPTGIAFCQACGLGSRNNGRLFFGAYNTGGIRVVTLNARRTGVTGQRIAYTHPSGVLSMEVGPSGVLYFSDSAGIYKLVRS
jgi:glucose/arabinose dehydrogenase